jgi:tetratricopeptide (TPR) repeat protein
MMKSLNRLRQIRKLKIELKHSPGNREAAQGLENLYEEAFMYRDLIELYSSTLKITELNLDREDLATIHHKLAIALSHLGEVSDAVTHLEMSIDLLSALELCNPEMMDLKASNFFNLYLLNQDEALLSAARNQYELLLSSYPEYEDRLYVHLVIAQIYMQLGMLDQAVSTCTDAMALVSDELKKADVYHTLGMIYQLFMDYTEAERYYFKSLDCYGKEKRYYSKVYYDLGRLYIEIGDKTKTRKAFGRALKFVKYSPWLRSTSNYCDEIMGYLKSSS